MVVRRTPGKKIRIVHEISKDVLELTVLHVSKIDSHNSRVHLLLNHHRDHYRIEWAVDYELGPSEGELILRDNGEIGILHRSGQRMEIQISDISHRDVNIRLVDKERLFRFDWSDQALANAS